MTPKRGDRYRTIRDVRVRGLVTFNNPSSGGFLAVLPRGEVVVVEHDPPAKARGVYAIPQRYEELEPALVPERDRMSDAYGSYALTISFDQLNEDFEQLPPSGAA